LEGHDALAQNADGTHSLLNTQRSQSKKISGEMYGISPVQSNTHRIHGAGIYANIGGILMVNVSIHSSTMDPMGYNIDIE
jgi:hypothetical protein